ncbi:MAG TPA: zf-HC2 domain-containing protein [Pseudomonadales bacterium]|nr:zf-HC2 domain-containing protein [Pseudomonadales bacterium]
MNTTSDQHARCVARLPAFVGGTLPAAEARAVAAHTAECSECRAELNIARRVHKHFAREWRNVAPLLDDASEDDGFDRLWAQITADASPRAPQRDRWNWTSRLTTLAATVTIAASYLWYGAAEVPIYRTLADPTSRGCVALHVQFRTATRPGEDRALIESTGARIVDGPDALGTYTLRASDPAESLRLLRALPDVTVAEPADC